MDAVFTWVDGNDPILKAKRQKYLTSLKEDTFEDVAGSARYVQSNEICFALASIIRFAPYIDRVFIITDGQRPHLDAFLRLNFPESRIEIRIIDHQEIFTDGLERFLPVFNSLSIEAMIYRIPGLSEEFVYLNDDVFFASPSKREDLFKDGKVVCHSGRMSVLLCRILRALRRERNGHKRLTYKDTLLNSALMVGRRTFFHLQHKPHPMLKSVLRDFFEAHPEELVRNARHRFRDAEQFNVQGLFYLLAEDKGLLLPKDPKGTTLMVRKTTGKPGYLERKLREADSSANLLFGCINSVQDMLPEEKELVLDWMCARLGVVLP